MCLKPFKGGVRVRTWRGVRGVWHRSAPRADSELFSDHDLFLQLGCISGGFSVFVISLQLQTSKQRVAANRPIEYAIHWTASKSIPATRTLA